jgi:glucose/arabinose dehydrogenase
MTGRSLRALVAVVLLAVAGIALRRTLAVAGAMLGLPGEVPAALRGEAEPTPAAVPAAAEVELVPVARGFRNPLLVTHAGDGSGRLFVVEQGGRVRVVRGGRVESEPFLDIADRLDTDRGERGLLGLAFAPDFASSGAFYIAQTAPGPEVRVVRFRVRAGSARADPGSAEVVLAMSDPASNHNGGGIVFGPDGHLWVGTGDGGSAGDPWDNARDRGSLLGKMLRLDVSRSPYGIPPDNPWAKGGARPEIWAIGLRNPWRFSFDRATGELWIGDVGQFAWEEIDVEDPKRGGGLHYGWRTMEGRHCFSPRKGCDPEGLQAPIHEYGHGEGCSVTGGYVYRGRALPALAGTYLFGDFCSGTLWGLTRDAAGRAAVRILARTGLAISSFGEDEAGEVYLCDHAGGAIYRIAPAA